MPDLVSILIPAYNAEKWIKETIVSALSQTWPRKEIIIVDDGSVDGTYAIAKQFESKSVKIISQGNKGASAARNKALEYAQGDFIQWLDADDLLAFDKISEQMKIAQGDGSGLTLYSSAYGTFYWRREKARFAENALWQDLSPLEWMLNKFRKNLWMPDAAWLVSRTITEKAGLWDERLSLDDDGEYFCRVVKASKKVVFVKRARAYYRNTGFNQLSKSASEKACRSLLLSSRLCIQYLRSMEESEVTRKACLALLQAQWAFYYLEKHGQREEFKKLVSELGGELMEPELSWKESLFNTLFGRVMGKEILTVLRKLKLGTAVKYDRLLFKFSKSSDHLDRCENKAIAGCRRD